MSDAQPDRADRADHQHGESGRGKAAEEARAQLHAAETSPLLSNDARARRDAFRRGEGWAAVIAASEPDWGLMGVLMDIPSVNVIAADCAGTDETTPAVGRHLDSDARPTHGAFDGHIHNATAESPDSNLPR